MSILTCKSSSLLRIVKVLLKPSNCLTWSWSPDVKWVLVQIMENVKTIVHPGQAVGPASLISAMAGYWFQLEFSLGRMVPPWGQVLGNPSKLSSLSTNRSETVCSNTSASSWIWSLYSLNDELEKLQSSEVFTIELRDQFRGQGQSVDSHIPCP